MTEADWQQLDPRFVPQQRVVGRIVAAAVALGSAAGLLIGALVGDDLPFWARPAMAAIWLLQLGIVASVVEMWPRRVFAHTRYRVDADGLQITRGVYWRQWTHVPRSRVQHTDVSQGPLERRYGLGTLVVYTAGTDHARVTLPGLAYETAVDLRDALRVDRHDDIV